MLNIMKYSEESISLNEQQIEDMVLKIIANHAGIKVSDIALTDKLEDDVGLDELDIVELGMELSEKFKIKDDDDYDDGIKNSKTVKSLIKFISKRIKKH